MEAAAYGLWDMNHYFAARMFVRIGKVRQGLGRLSEIVSPSNLDAQIAVRGATRKFVQVALVRSQLNVANGHVFLECFLRWAG